MRFPPLTSPTLWRAGFGLGCGMQAALSGGMADAQSITPERRFHVGLSSVFETDSNVLRAADADLTTPNRSDLRWAPALNLDIERPLGRQDVYLLGNIGYNFYAHNPQLDTSGVNLQSGVDVRAGHRCAARIGGEYVRQLANLNDLSATPLGHTVQNTTAYIARLNCDRGYRLHPTLGYRHEAVRNSAAKLSANDTVSDAFDASVRLQRARFGEISMYGNYRRGRYPHHAAGSSDAVQFYNAGLSYSRSIGAKLRGSVSFGYTMVVPHGTALKRYHGASWTTDVSYTPTSRTHVSFGMTRDSQQSSLLDINYSITTSAHIRADYALTHMVRLSLGAQVSRHAYHGASAVTVATLGQGDRSTSLTAGLSYAPPMRVLRHRITVAADVTYNRRTADNPAFNTHNLVASLSLRMEG